MRNWGERLQGSLVGSFRTQRPLHFTSHISPRLTSLHQLAMPRLQPTLPFWLHLLIELPASMNFFLNPSEQLSSPAPQAHPIIKQYAVLLFVSILIALIFALRSIDRTSRNVAGALSVYHLAPLMRAGSRIVEGSGEYGKGLGGPILHLAVHMLCFVGLLWVFLKPRGIKGIKSG